MPGDTFDAFVEDYFAECDEHLSAIRRRLVSGDARAPRQLRGPELADIARRLDTIRALSKIVELDAAEELATALQELLEESFQPDLAPSRDVLELFLAGVGLLDRSIQSKRGWHPVPDHQKFIAGARDFVRRHREESAGAVLQTASAAVRADVDADEDTPGAALIPLPRPEPTPSPEPGPHELHVELARVDDLTRIAGELIALRDRLEHTLRHHVDDAAREELRGTTRALQRQLRDLREGVVRMRRLAMNVLFERIRLVTQDALRSAGRTVRLEFSGGDTRIDASMVQALAEPLLLLVRIVALHGIETRGDRLIQGKPAEGTIALRARSTGDRIVLETQDDGDGDLAARAPQRGQDIAAVRGEIGALGGELKMSAAPGRGTRFTIEVPIRDAITDALLAGVGDQIVAVPLPSLREVLRLEPQQMTSVLGAGMIAWRGTALPLLSLRRHLELASRKADATKAYVVVVEVDASPTGLVVDDVLDIRDVVPRPLHDPRLTGRGVTGATELPDGRLALVVDATALVRRARAVPPPVAAADAAL